MIRPYFSLCLVLVLVGSLALLSCGNPVASDKGTAGNVIDVDIPTGQYQPAGMLIGFDSTEEFQKLQALVPTRTVRTRHIFTAW